MVQSGLPIVAVISSLEQSLNFMRTSEEHLKTSGVSQELAFLRILLCTMHHVILHRYYYTAVREKQASMLVDLCGIGSTVSYARKLVGERSCWSKALRDLKNVVAVVDEVQSLGSLEVAGACALYRTCIAAGDKNQDISDLLYTPSDAKPIVHSAAMLRKRDIIAQAKRNDFVQVLDNQENMRYGQPLLQHLRTLVPFMSEVTTALSRDTYLLPVFFNFVGELTHQTDAGEISRDTSMFVSRLVVVAFETVVAA